METVIVTSEETQIVMARAMKLGISHCHIGVPDKSKLLDVICTDLGVVPDQVAHIGDDVNDLSLLARVGLSAAPADGFGPVREQVDYVCKTKGGDGAFREFAEYIIGKLKLQNCSSSLLSTNARILHKI